jgi:hypothetical protein
VKIGFFGDSFCSDKRSWSLNYDTYISMIEKRYDANIVHLGVAGSSIGDVILLQLKPFIEQNNVPDICIFSWTEPHRLFHRTVRQLNYSSSDENVSKSSTWKAAHDYYKYLWDKEFTELQYLSLLEHIDNKILTVFPKNTKIIHMWSFGKTLEKNSDISDFHYTWSNGVEIKTTLAEIGYSDSSLEEFLNDHGPNHLTTKQKNQQVFDLICDSIDNYLDKARE